MFLPTSEVTTTSGPQDQFERLRFARELFQQFHAQCFWHSPRDLDITEDLSPFVANGLRANGGRLGFRLAGKLQPNASEREVPECR
jgi:hypothetical protein